MKKILKLGGVFIYVILLLVLISCGVDNKETKDDANIVEAENQQEQEANKIEMDMSQDDDGIVDEGVDETAEESSECQNEDAESTTISNDNSSGQQESSISQEEVEDSTGQIDENSNTNESSQEFDETNEEDLTTEKEPECQEYDVYLLSYEVEYSGDDIMWTVAYEYNDEAKLIKKTRHWTDTGADETRLYEYDEMGRIIRTIYYYDIKISSPDITEYEYDLTGKLIREIDLMEESDGGNRITEYIYDEHGLLIRKEIDGVIDEEYFYNDKSQLIEKKIQGSRIYYEYDSEGNKIKATKVSKMGSHDFQEIYEYDINGKPISYKTIIGYLTTVEIYWEYEYDAHGNATKKVDVSEPGDTGIVCTLYEYIGYAP